MEDKINSQKWKECLFKGEFLAYNHLNQHASSLVGIEYIDKLIRWNKLIFFFKGKEVEKRGREATEWIRINTDYSANLIPHLRYLYDPSESAFSGVPSRISCVGEKA